jgi:hypothetical protein
LLTAPTGTPETSTIQLDRRPIGTRSVDVTSSATKDRWAIHVSQRFERTIEVQTVTQQKARRYLFWPLAPLSGLTQCPVGLLASVFSSNESIANMRQVGCMRLVAMEPLRNVIPRKAITDRDQTTQEADAPLAGADVLFTPDDHDGARLQQVTLTDGVATIQTKSTTDQVGELLVRANNRTHLTQRITITGQPDRGIPLLHWPDPAIVQIEPFTGSDGKTRPSLQDTLSALFLARGLDVLPLQPRRDAILDEQAVQLAGRVSDSSAVRTGRLVRPTVLIKGIQSPDGELSLTVMTVKTGEQQEIHVKQLADLMDVIKTPRQGWTDER